MTEKNLGVATTMDHSLEAISQAGMAFSNYVGDVESIASAAIIHAREDLKKIKNSIHSAYMD